MLFSVDLVTVTNNASTAVESSPSRKVHHRSKSENSLLSLPLGTLPRTASNSFVSYHYAGDLSSGRAFQTDSLTAQKTFIRTLEAIGKRLQLIKTREMRSENLFMDKSSA